MTMITLSTVGYGEVIDLSTHPQARLFATAFIFLCLGTIAFAVSSITSFIIEGELKNILGRKKMDKKIAKLSNHFIVCGTGDTAMTVIQELLLTQREFVVVESQRERIEKLAGLGDFLFVHGDPSEDDILEAAGITQAHGILLALPTDEANLFVTITARSLNPQIRIVTKGTDVKSHKKIRTAGADAVISPSYIGGMRMVSEMVRPRVVGFLDMMLRERDKVYRFEEVTVAEGSDLVGKEMLSCAVKEKTGALIVGIKRAESGEFDFNPARDRQIQVHDVLICVASPEMIQKLERLAGNA